MRVILRLTHRGKGAQVLPLATATALPTAGPRPSHLSLSFWQFASGFSGSLSLKQVTDASLPGFREE